jgi:tRNA U34 5-methylaminomethyl-2-thiouridine-forming methyltransferase MnmC
MSKENLKTFNGKLGSYSVIQTDDNTTTLYSEFYDENCHSTSGAVEETLYNYIEGCNLLEKSKSNRSLVIFEVGLGIGLGPKLTYETFKDRKTDIKFISTEIDEALVEYSKEHNKCDIFKNLKRIEEDELVYYVSKFENFSLYILIGDARITTSTAFKKGVFKKVDAIFQDAFSPKKNPTLWTKQWFEQLRHISNDQVLMTTYSSHISVRKSMYEAGWKVFKRKGFGEKRSMTLCSLSGEMNEDILRNIKTAPDPILSDV